MARGISTDLSMIAIQLACAFLEAALHHRKQNNAFIERRPS
jgi:hypothetical protein